MSHSIKQACKQAKNAAFRLAQMESERKNQLLLALAERLNKNKARIAEANQKDLDEASTLLAQGELSQPLVKRLNLQGEKIDQLGNYLAEVAKLPDPVGIRQYAMRLDTGLDLERVSCPLGVLAVIFESRPEVVIQVSALSLKSSNAVLLKGGREAAHSNRVLWELINEVLTQWDLAGAVALMESREDVQALLNQEEFVDLIIPRGSNAFVRYIQDNTRIPVLGHAEGLCHMYLAGSADLNQALDLVFDAKTDYPSACNALETLLVEEKLAPQILPQLFTRLQNAGVELRVEANLLAYGTNLKTATEKDWATEYTDLILSIKQVAGLDEAIAHINRYGSGHTDSILTEDKKEAETFLNQVDSACVFHNTSTRFSDGFVFGLGAEVGISTNKTHARGPVGLEGLVIYKYKLRGSGQKISAYGGAKGKSYLHQPLPLQP